LEASEPSATMPRSRAWVAAAIGGVGFHERARVASAPVIEVVEAGEKVRRSWESCWQDTRRINKVRLRVLREKCMIEPIVRVRVR
jgi:hypothetical protein